jgi:hypothetical protein
VIRGRRITAEDIALVREVVVKFFGFGRTHISLELCRRWQWRTGAGRFKARSALGILLELERRGEVRLPPRLSERPARKPSPKGRGALTHWSECSPVVQGGVRDCRPLRWERCGSPSQHQEWRQLLDRHHYLGAPGLVGASLK